MTISNSQNSVNNKWVALSAGLAIVAVGVVSPNAKAATFSLDFDSGANGGAVTYNADGSLDTRQWAGIGLNNISGVNDRTKGAAVLNTYNSSVFRNDTLDRDWDLTTGTFTRNGKFIDTGVEKQGNVLIIQEEDGHSFNTTTGKFTADDERDGGEIKFDFAEAVFLNSFLLMDIDDNNHNDQNRIRVKGSSANGNLNIDVDRLINDHKTANGNSQGSTFTRDGVTITQVGKKRDNNSMYQFDLDETYFANMRFEQVEFEYPGSGAIAGIKWSTKDAGPKDIPEPSVVGGLLMLGFVGARKKLKSNQSVVEAA